VQPYRRETVIALFNAFFSKLFSKSNLFIIEPFSYALTWLSFLSFGILILKFFCNKKSSYWMLGVGFTTYAIAIFSSAGQAFWTSSFLSHYYNQCISMGLNEER